MPPSIPPSLTLDELSPPDEFGLFFRAIVKESCAAELEVWISAVRESVVMAQTAADQMAKRCHELREIAEALRARAVGADEKKHALREEP